MKHPVNPTLVIWTDYDTGLAFEGPDGVKAMELLRKAKPVKRGWSSPSNVRFCTEDEITALSPDRILVLFQDINRSNEDHAVRKRLAEVEDILAKHKDLIEGAEQLQG